MPRKIRKMLSMNLFQKLIAWRLPEWFLHDDPWKDWHMVGQPWFSWLCQQVEENACPWMKDFCSPGWFQLKLCGGLAHVGVGCWHHVISCSAIQILSLLHVVCYCKVMWHLQRWQYCSQAEAGGIRGAVESICCFGCIRGLSPQEAV